MAELTPLWDPMNGQMNVAGYMSGSGSNLRKIIQYEHKLKENRGGSPYHLAVIFSNRHDSNAALIGYDHDVPVISRDERGFAQVRGRKFSELREEFDNETLNMLAPYDCRVAALGGYGLFVSRVILEQMLTINVHPADLSIEKNGKRVYTGNKAVRLQLIAGEPFLRSTMHIVDELEDHGPMLMRSAPLNVQYPISNNILDVMAGLYQEALKTIADWVIYPKTLEFIADGRYARDRQGNLYFDGRQIPDGVMVEELAA